MFFLCFTATRFVCDRQTVSVIRLYRFNDEVGDGISIVCILGNILIWWAFRYELLVVRGVGLCVAI